MIPLIRRELVEKKRWLTEAEFVDLLALAQSSPGPIAINTCVICGFKVFGLPGAIVGALASALPSFVSIVAVAAVFIRFKDSREVEAVFRGIRPAIFGLLVAAIFQVGRSCVRTRRDLAIFVSTVVLLVFLKINPMMVVLLAAITGLALGQLARKKEG